MAGMSSAISCGPTALAVGEGVDRCRALLEAGLLHAFAEVELVERPEVAEGLLGPLAHVVQAAVEAACRALRLGLEPDTASPATEKFCLVDSR